IRSTGDSGVAARTKRNVRLLDHIIRAQQQRLRDGDTERLGGLEVDYELELRRLLERQVVGFRAFNYPVRRPLTCRRQCNSGVTSGWLPRPDPLCCARFFGLRLFGNDKTICAQLGKPRCSVLSGGAQPGGHDERKADSRNRRGIARRGRRERAACRASSRIPGLVASLAKSYSRTGECWPTRDRARS